MKLFVYVSARVITSILHCYNCSVEETGGCYNYCTRQLSVDAIMGMVDRGQQKYNGFSFSKK